MNVGFHFDADHKSFTTNYGRRVLDAVFKALLGTSLSGTHSEIRVGDLLLRSMASHRVDIGGGRSVEQTDTEALLKLTEEWIQPSEGFWINKLQLAYDHNIYVVYFKSMPEAVGLDLNKLLSPWEPYLGARRISTESSICDAYERLLIPMFRLHDRTLKVFWDPLSDNPKEIGLRDHLKELGFDDVGFEEHSVI